MSSVEEVVSDVIEEGKKDKKICREDITVSVEKNLITTLEKNVKDPRKPNGQRYSFVALIATIIIASLCGFTSPTDIARFCALELIFLNEALGEQYEMRKAPSHDTFGRMLKTICSSELSVCLSCWINANFQNPTMYTHDRIRHIACDGKAGKAVAIKSEGEPTRYVLNAYESGGTILLFVQDINGKGNETTMIPVFLDEVFRPENTILTADAAATNELIIKIIIEKNWLYLLCLKNNQKILFRVTMEKIQELKDRISALDSTKSAYESLPTAESYQKAHGREEHIVCRVISGGDLDFLIRLNDGKDENDTNFNLYRSIKSIGIIEKTVTKKIHGKIVTTTSTRLYISNIENIDPKQVIDLRHEHWKVEATHYKLDTELDEDKQTLRSESGFENGCILRRFVLNMLIRDPVYALKTPHEYIMANLLDLKRILSLINMECTAS